MMTSRLGAFGWREYFELYGAQALHTLGHTEQGAGLGEFRGEFTTHRHRTVLIMWPSKAPTTDMVSEHRNGHFISN